MLLLAFRNFESPNSLAIVRLRSSLQAASSSVHGNGVTLGIGGPVELDETYMGGKRKNMPKSKRKAPKGRGPVGKTAVVGAMDRATMQIAAKFVASTDKGMLQGFVQDHAAKGATVYTDDVRTYKTLPVDHDPVKHSLQESMEGDVHTNGIESLWCGSSGRPRAHSTS